MNHRNKPQPLGLSVVSYLQRVEMTWLEHLQLGLQFYNSIAATKVVWVLVKVFGSGVKIMKVGI